MNCGRISTGNIKRRLKASLMRSKIDRSQADCTFKQYNAQKRPFKSTVRWR